MKDLIATSGLRYVVHELFYNWTSVPTYPGRYVLLDISDTVTRKQYLVPPLTLDSDVVSTEGICYEQRIRESPGGACLKIFLSMPGWSIH